MARPSRRMIAFANRLGIQGAADMSYHQLADAIDLSPASAAQFEFARTLLQFLGRPVPDKLTVEEAEGILNDVVPHVNERVCFDRGWKEGTVLLWRGEAYVITDCHGGDHKISITRVDIIEGGPGDPPEFAHTKARREVHHPITLALEDAEVLGHVD